jgi:hypothetical protein
MVLVAPRRAPEKARAVGLTKTLNAAVLPLAKIYQSCSRIVDAHPRSARRRGTSRDCSWAGASGDVGEAQFGQGDDFRYWHIADVNRYLFFCR